MSKLESAGTKELFLLRVNQIEENKLTKLCKCGCGALIPTRNKSGEIFYVWGHGRKGKKYPNENKDQYGEKNNNYKGGRIIHTEGYILVRSEGHPRSKGKGQYVMEHILIMEKHLGRYLQENECVHHINDIKDDNRIENLQLTNKEKHSRYHRLKQLGR